MKAASVMALALVLAASLCSGEVVFEEDFESPEDYKRRNGQRRNGRRNGEETGTGPVLTRPTENNWTCPRFFPPPFLPPDAVRPEGNQLEIEVANHWINRIIGDETLPPEQRFTQTNVEAKTTPLQPSGLLGPVGLFIAKD